MTGYVSLIARDGKSGTIRNHGDGTPYSFFGYSGWPLAYQQRVTFDAQNQEQRIGRAVNIQPVVAGNGDPSNPANGVFDEPLQQRLTDSIP